MAKFKLIGIDMDGTLLNNDLKISQRAAEAIRKAQAQGVHVTLCTGRMYASALPYAQEIGLELPLITYNGAYVKHSGTGEILYQRSLPAPYAQHIFLKAKEKDLHVNVYAQDQLFVEKVTQWGRRYANVVRVPINVVENMMNFLEQDPLKMVVLADPPILEVLSQELKEELGDKIYITKSAPNFLELMHPEANKGRGLQAVAEYFQISQEQVMGIGDNYNDLAMFQYAGFAVAMGNAEEEVKKYADYVTGSNDDDGVAEAIEKLVLMR